MAYKIHCDLCDAIIPETDNYIYLVQKTDYTGRDWRRDDNPIGCMLCVQALLPHELAERFWPT